MIDFHCHLDLYPDPRMVARTCVERGLYVLSVTTTPSAWPGTRSLAEGAPRIRTALGLHPHLARVRAGEIPLFERYVSETSYVGEVGLDGAQEHRRDWGVQLSVFRSILGTCEAAGGRVLSIHSRRAAGPVLDEIEARSGAGTPILHWFSGGNRELARALALDCWFSVGPSMLRGEKGRALAARIPRDRLLTETDGPFAQVEGRSFLPWEVQEATTILSAIWKLPVAEAMKQLGKNLLVIGDLARRYRGSVDEPILSSWRPADDDLRIHPVVPARSA